MEEISTVTAQGDINRGPTGEADIVNGHILSGRIAIPEGEGNTSIHSPILDVKKGKNGIYQFGEANVPSEVYDVPFFKHFSQNIIVGPLSSPTIKIDKFGGESISYPTAGAVFFNSKSVQTLILTESAVKKMYNK